MKLRQSERKNVKIKMALQSLSSGGKTYGALLLAKGLSNGGFSKVVVIDTENGSSDLYAHLGDYNILKLEPPYSPEKYIEALEFCEKAGMEVIIIDSISHCWDHLLEVHKNMSGNSFTNWGKITPRHNAFVNKILSSNTHIIATMRVKQDYVLNQKNGKYIPEKVGLRAIQRNGIEYEFSLVFDISIEHFARSTKDRTGLFMGKAEFIINTNTGRRIFDWCNSIDSQEDVLKRVNECLSVGDLMKLYNLFPAYRKPLNAQFQIKKQKLESLKNIKNHEHRNIVSSDKR